MPVTVQEFWRLIVASGLYDEVQCRQLASQFAAAKDEGKLPATTSLPEWLVGGGVLSRYQAKILLAGRAGPFVFGDYVVSERIESDELAGLFRAIHRPIGTPVCLKFLSGAGATAEAIDALRRQAEPAAALSRQTPFLVHCHGVIDGGAYKFLVIEDLPGVSLRARLAKGTALSTNEASRVAGQVAQGLARCHQQGRAHGAVRPDRIWLVDGNRAALMEFPLLGKLPPDGAAANELSEADIDYRPPELRPGDAPTPTGDIYSLGCTLYQMLAGRVPFAEGDIARRSAAHRTGTPRPLDQVNPAVPAELSSLVGRMLAKNPTARFAGAAEFAAALAACAKGGKSQDAAAATPPAARALLDQFLAADRTGLVTSAADMTEAVAVVTSDDREPARGSSAARLQRPRRNNMPLFVGLSAALLLVIGGAIIFFASTGGQRTTSTIAVTNNSPAESDRRPANRKPMADDVASPPGVSSTDEASGGDAAATPANTASAATEQDSIAPVTGVMWASPTRGQPLNLSYLPPGATVIVALRPAHLLARPEGERLFDPRTSGEFGQWLVESLPKQCGVPLAKMEQLLIGLYSVRDGVPQVALVIRTGDAMAQVELLKAWGNPPEKSRDDVVYFHQGETAYYLPVAESGRVIVVGPAAAIVDDVIPAGSDPPLLRREIEVLLAASDADRDVTLLAEPNVVLTGSDQWFPGSLARLRPGLDWFLSGHATGESPETAPVAEADADKPRTTDLSSFDLPNAVLASAHLTDQDLFVEVRLEIETNRPITTVAKDYQARVERFSKRVSDFVRGLALSEYSRDVLLGFPLMVEQLAHHTVTGSGKRQVVLRAYLPAVAAHNLALASRLSLIESPRASASAGGAVATSGTKPNPSALPKQEPPESVAQRLDRKITVRFDRNPLEKALAIVGEEIGVPVVILGKDLQVEGITKNKSFGLAEEDRPAREILQKIMLSANPDGKLIYVVKPAEDGAGEALYITTRAAAKERGDKLPAEFAEP